MPSHTGALITAEGSLATGPQGSSLTTGGSSTVQQADGSCRGCMGIRCGAPVEVEEACVPAYVGVGRGAYKQETTYKYVGEGAGEFDLYPTRQRRSWLCCCLVPCLALALLLPLLYVGLMKASLVPPIAVPLLNRSPDPNVEIVASAGARSAKWDCTNMDDWQHKWCDEQKEFCCLHYQKGCFDCTDGRETWQRWTAEKKAYCCRLPGLCQRPTRPPFDCNDGFEHWQTAWSTPQKAYCCAHARRGCPTVAPPAKIPFQCDVGYSNWQAGWSHGKKAYCCEHEQKGCAGTVPPHPPVPPTMPFNCASAFHNWQAAWSPGKKRWCCDHEHKGCPLPPPPPPPPPPATSPCPPMDCWAGFNNWRLGWTETKKRYCCLHEHKACPPY